MKEKRKDNNNCLSMSCQKWTRRNLSLVHKRKLTTDRPVRTKKTAIQSRKKKPVSIALLGTRSMSKVATRTSTEDLLWERAQAQNL